ncbi:MAG: lipoyl(octanoyl) transferase LipB [Chloroflexi bacterium]|nr:lipoyl(octanoyl) transferase LipB [Chloroflexota bacterium]
MLNELTERARSATRPLSVVDLGVIGYAECWKMQNRLAAQVASGEASDTLLLLEHPHTYTCGRRGGRDHILASEDQLAREGIALLDVDRGGDVTYHGPGQLVSYPIINLLRDTPTVDYHAYLRSLEWVLIGTLADFAINAYRLPGYSGVWVGEAGCEEKIAAIGVRVDGRGITTHGVALNITTDLSYFSKIVPCGISNKGVSSMAKLMPDVPSMAEVKASFASHFAAVFGFFV